MSKRWGTLENFFLEFIDELEKQIIKKTVTWANKNKIISIFTILHFLQKYKEKHCQNLDDLQFLRYRAKHTEIGNYRSFLALLPPKNPKNQDFKK